MPSTACFGSNIDAAKGQVYSVYGNIPPPLIFITCLGKFKHQKLQLAYVRAKTNNHKSKIFLSFSGSGVRTRIFNHHPSTHPEPSATILRASDWVLYNVRNQKVCLKLDVSLNLHVFLNKQYLHFQKVAGLKNCRLRRKTVYAASWAEILLSSEAAMTLVADLNPARSLRSLPWPARKQDSLLSWPSDFRHLFNFLVFFINVTSAANLLLSKTAL